MSGALVEVRASPIDEALETLRRRPDVREAALFGSAIHATGDSPEAAAALQPALLAEGMSVDSVRQVRPSLEDAFVSLVERDETRRGAAEGAGRRGGPPPSGKTR
jgi:ABC-2 type transport system ATP-binding protein